MVSLQAIHRLPVPIQFLPEVIGVELSARIADVEVVVAMPKHPTSLEYHGAMWPRLEPPTVDGDVLKSEEEFAKIQGDEFRWGRPQRMPLVSYGVEALVISVEVAAAAEANATADRVRRSLDSWTDLACRWIQASTRQALDRKHPPRRVVHLLSETRFYGIVEGARARPAKLIDRSMQFVSDRVEPVSMAIWQRALKHASAAEDLPIEHRFLVDSLNALRSGQPRRAVLDAATAVELVAAQVLEREVRAATSSSPLIDFLLDRYDTLGSIDQLLRRFGIVLHNELSKKISQPRNDAIHQGHEPTETEAAEVFDLAAGVVESHSPLPH